MHADLRDFFDAAERAAMPATDKAAERAEFLQFSRERSARFPVVLPEYWSNEGPINPYVFGKVLFDELEEGDIVVSGDGTACVTIFQVADLKDGQRLYTNSGCASMGYDLPAAIGAYYAANGHEGTGKRIICLAGDGSIMMNLQELQTIAGAKLPIKLFVLNNDGYHSIRQSQQNHFPDNIVGCGPDSGLTFPEFDRLAGGFGIPASKVTRDADLSAAIRAALDGDGPHLCEVMIDKRQEFAPKLSSRRLEDGTMVSPTLEDLSPFLETEVLREAMAPCEILR
jgi:acetolactate synthase-1/2/3 large subunit